MKTATFTLRLEYEGREMYLPSLLCGPGRPPRFLVRVLGRSIVYQPDHIYRFSRLDAQVPEPESGEGLLNCIADRLGELFGYN